MTRASRYLFAPALASALACGGEVPPRKGGPPAGWPVYAHDDGGSRYSPLDEITPANVRFLEKAWEYHTGDLKQEGARGNHSFQTTPILIGDALYFCTPSSRIVSLDAETGAERWVFDPQIDRSLGHYMLNCRGVAHWEDRAAAPGSPCRSRIYVATADTRLVAVDAETGARCSGFGTNGEVEFWRDVPLRARGEYGISSPPVVVRDAIVLGSAVAENRRVDMPSGKVHAFHARTGAPLWTWDPIPRDPSDPARATWENGADVTGAANVWSLGSADPERDLVFLPTSSPSPDFYGGERLGDNLYADSVVALRGSTGAPTQPFPTWPPPLSPQRLDPDQVFGLTFWDRGRCRELLATLRNDGIFTPPSFEGSLVYPGIGGGSNWGSVAYDPERKLLVANTSSAAQVFKLIPRDQLSPEELAARFGSAMEGTPYLAQPLGFLSPWQFPCDPPPWGSLTALDLGARELRWKSKLGTTRDLAPLGIPIPFGVPNLGGPIATAGGLIFIGATMDDYLRAFDLETGEELWKARLPAGGQATPMTYRVRRDGRQFVVIAAGGHAMLRTRPGDSVIAWALP